MRLTGFSSIGNAGADSVAKDVAFEFSEHGQHAGQGSAAWRSHVERLRTRRRTRPPRREAPAGWRSDRVTSGDRQKKLKQSDYTVDNIVAAVRTLVGGAEWYQEVFKEIARYIVLDALICNTDRHHENWGFLTTYQTSEAGDVSLSLRMARSFDHASSLGRELLDERATEILVKNGVATYARRGHGGIY